MTPPIRAESRALGWKRGTLLALLIVHVGLCAAAFLTMDADLDRGALRDASNAVIDGYEAVGFGIFPVGMALVTVALVAALLYVRRVERPRPR